MTVLLAPKRKRVILFVLEVVCPVCSQYTFSLPNSVNCYFLVFQNACPNLTLTCTGQSRKCLSSTLVPYVRNCVCEWKRLVASIARFEYSFLPCYLSSVTGTQRG